MTAPNGKPGRFVIGKYNIVAEPVPDSRQMLRYTVYVGKTRVGAMVSVPSESDCQFLENPPVVPPLKIFYVTSRPGRPKKGAKPAPVVDRDPAGYRQALPSDVTLDGMKKPTDC